ncbi:MAG: acetate--CoA ligase alpha subunit [Bacillota bacterium]
MTLASILKPESVAIVGASKTPGKIGNVLVRNIIDSGYQGKIYPINPKETEIEGITCYPGLPAVQEKIDLAVMAIPAARTPEVAEQCGQAGVKGLVIISAGFKEVGRAGLHLEKELLRICKKYGMRLVGPNCVGVIDTHTPINASFSGTYPRQGNIAFISQSGAMLVAILDWSRKSRLGFSKVISLGNKADLNEADFIEDAAADPHTKVILCYIEDVANGAQFLEVARLAGRQKPVIIYKSGTSVAGARAASSHTGALAGSDLAYETAFRQTGVIRARSMAELFDLAAAFVTQPVPAGDRVAVVTNAGGPGIITTDNVEKADLKMARFQQTTTQALRASLPAASAIYNPVDVLGDGGPERYQNAVAHVLADPGVDSVLVLVCPTAVTDDESIARAILRARQNAPDKPLFGVFLGGEYLAKGRRLFEEAGIPCFTFPEPAVLAISGMVGFARTQKIPLAEPAEQFNNLRKESVKRVLEKVKKDGRLVLLGSEAARVAEAYGIPVAPVYLAATPEEAAQHAQELGFPVVMKVASPQIIHKTDVGGIITNIKTAGEAQKSFIQISENVHRYFPELVIHGVEVQKMMPKGDEVLIGMTRDLQFGPLIAFGLGGIYVNLLKDVAFRLAHRLTRREIQNMIMETKAYTLLRGYRGEKPKDINSLAEIIARVARLGSDFPEIAEMDINPLFAYPDGAVALDVKITIS